MKSRQASPQPEVVRMRAFRLEASTDPLKLSAVKGNQPTTHLSPSDHHASIRPVSQASHTSSNSRIHDYEAHQSMADPIDIPASSARRLDLQPSHSNIHQPDDSPGDSNEPWSSAVGRATVGGKSGRVIERLMADNDKLRREMKVLVLKAEEEQKRGDLAKSALDSLQGSYQNLETICDANQAALVRKDRKIEELREDLKEERRRREQAQALAKDTLNETERAIETAHEEMQRGKDIAAQATTQYEVLSSQVKRKKLERQKEIDQLVEDMNTVQQRVKVANERCDALETTCMQLQQECERTTQINRQLRDSYKEYRNTSDSMLQSLKKDAISAGEKIEEAHNDMVSTAGSMRMVMNIRRDFKGDFKE